MTATYPSATRNSHLINRTKLMSRLTAGEQAGPIAFDDARPQHQVTNSGMRDESNYDIPTGPYRTDASVIASVMATTGPASEVVTTATTAATSCGKTTFAVAYCDAQRWCSSVAFPVRNCKLSLYTTQSMAKSQP
ncbi:unnamed protein product, partial [Soboliphyme baturini]|uniref:Beta-lactamase domain-containing protein n=1 Tax=Soboliphyme baturini TaxID=241478 RepID=A0A183JB91_9BILA